MTDAGELRWRVDFEQRAEVDGDRLGDFVAEFDRRAKFTFLRGSEPVLAQRLQGVQPVVIRVRAEARTRAVTAEWRIRDRRSGKLYEIKSVTPDESGAWIDFLAEGEGRTS